LASEQGERDTIRGVVSFSRIQELETLATSVRTFQTVTYWPCHQKTSGFCLVYSATRHES